MKNGTSYKLDGEARLWVRPADGNWRLATSEEADRIFLCYPEFAAQAFWVGVARPRHVEADQPRQTDQPAASSIAA